MYHTRRGVLDSQRELQSIEAANLHSQRQVDSLLEFEYTIGKEGFDSEIERDRHFEARKPRLAFDYETSRYNMLLINGQNIESLTEDYINLLGAYIK